MTESSDLARRVLSGRHPRMARLAAEGVLPLPLEELVPIQVALVTDGDPEIGELARDSLLGLHSRVIRDFLRESAPPEVLAFFAAHSDKPAVVEAVLQRRDVPTEVLVAVAPLLSAEMQEILLLRQDRILASPEIVEALERNPELSPYSQRVVGEYRLHLLAPDEPEEAVEEERVEVEDELDEAEEEELRQEVDRVLEEVEPEGDVDERSGLSEAQVRALAAPLRVRLARGASRTLRSILLRDPNPQVAVTVLHRSAVTEAEVEQAAANRYIVDEVLTEISRRREWVARYQVAQNLCRNPRTPVGVAVRLLPRLSVRDLSLLRRDRNVADAVRQQAARLFNVKAR